MKKFGFAFIASVMLAACNNSKQEQQYKALAARDSVLMTQAQQKDSTINSYIHSLNEIQDNLDSIKVKEKILSIKSEGAPANQAVADIKALDRLIVRNNRRIYWLERRLRTTGKKDANLEKLVANLTKELAEKDAEIVDLENGLAKANDSIKLVVGQLSDSIAVINSQRGEINAMRSEINTVYYAIGSKKELKSKGVISKTGGFIGLGRTAELKQDFNVSYFTKADLNDLHALALNARFVKLITNHPRDSYKISGNKKVDSLYITDPVAFWSKSKYLVIMVK